MAKFDHAAFNLLHDEDLTIEDKNGRTVTIDINPINRELSGTIDGCWYLSSKCPMQTGAQQLIQAKQTKQQENLNKANEAVLKGYVTYKGCQFETNTDNQSNMTATANLMQAQGIEATQWLSKDNIPIELTLSDFLNIGGLVLNYKTNLWTNVYAGFEAQIEAAQTIEDIENIVINYNVFSAWGMLSSLREAI